jgi:SAM-dependent methyltransferase
MADSLDSPETIEGELSVGGVDGVDPMYESFADAFGEHAIDSAYNAHYDRPVVRDLVGDPTGLRLLDAGCGSGILTAELVSAGATVTAFDASPRLVDLARERLAGRAEVRVWDLSVPLTWLNDSSFDVVVLALVLHHLPRRDTALGELFRVMRPGGALVVSTTHPTADWLRLGGGFFDVTEVAETWHGDWPVTFWRQPLTSWCREFTDAGFLIERLVEHEPAASMADAYPETYAQLSTNPGFVAFRLLKPASRTRGHQQ